MGIFDSFLKTGKNIVEHSPEELEAARDFLKMNPSLAPEAFIENQVPDVTDEISALQKAQEDIAKQSSKSAEQSYKQDLKQTFKGKTPESNLPSEPRPFNEPGSKSAKQSASVFEKEGSLPLDEAPAPKEVPKLDIPVAKTVHEKNVDKLIGEHLSSGKRLSELQIDKDVLTNPEARARYMQWLRLGSKNSKVLESAFQKRLADKASKVSDTTIKQLTQNPEEVEGFASPMLPRGQQPIPAKVEAPIPEAPSVEVPSVNSYNKEELSPFGEHIPNLGNLPEGNTLLQLVKNNPKMASALGLSGASLTALGLSGDSGKQLPPVPLRNDYVPETPATVSPVTEPSKSEIPDMDGSAEQAPVEEETPAAPEESKVQMLAKLLAQDSDTGKYKEALAKRDFSTLINQLGKAGELFGSSLSRTKPVAQELFDQNIKLAQQGPEDFKENIAMQEHDPESAVSKNYREFLKRYGVEVGPGITAAQVKSTLLPALEKETLQKEKLASTEAYRQRTDAFKQTRIDTTKENLAKRQLEAAKTRALNTIGGTAGNTVRNRIQSADAIFSTVGIDNISNENDIEKIPDETLNKLPPQFIAELTVETNRMLTGTGVPAQSTFQKLMPKNMEMTAANIKNWVTSEMGPANQASFAKLVLKTAARVKRNSQKSLSSLVKKNFAGTEHIRKQLPEDYENVIKELDLNPEDFGFKATQSEKSSEKEPLETVKMTKDGVKWKEIPANRVDEAMAHGYRQ